MKKHLVFCLSICVVMAAACGEDQRGVTTGQAEEVLIQLRAQIPGARQLLGRGLPLRRTDRGFAPAAAKPAMRQGSGWRVPGPHRLDVTLPVMSDGVTRIDSGPVTLQIRALGARKVEGQVDDGVLVYSGAYPHADTLMVAERQRAEEFILLRDERAPRSFEYDLAVTRGGGRVRQMEDTIEVLDAEDNAWLRLAPAYLVDSSGVRKQVRVRLTRGKLEVAVPPGALNYPVLLDPGWITTGTMTKNRYWHSATLMNTGKVLVTCVGLPGLLGAGSSTSAELFNPATRTWTAAASLPAKQALSVAVLLPSGKVLVYGANNDLPGYKAVAARYDPSANSWSATAKITGGGQGRPEYPSATLLSTGKVLVAGKSLPWGGNFFGALLYDPTSNSWTTTGFMKSSRQRHQAVLLNSGAVLVAGGHDGKVSGGSIHNSAEIYNPTSGKWTATGSMAAKRESFRMVLLDNGKVLAFGGKSSLKSAELYDPLSGKWSATGSMASGREGSIAVTLKSGKVLVSGGVHSAAAKTAELYDPSAGSWSGAASMSLGRRWHSGTLLSSGLVLVAGGQGTGAANSAELFDPTSGLSCQKAAQCNTGYCVDGICCETACLATCMQCTVVDGAGRCLALPAGQQVTGTATPCVGTNTCDGKGACKKITGQKCSAASECVSGSCADGLCCDKPCDGACVACNLPGKPGTCSPLAARTPDPAATPPCTVTSLCNGAGACKSADGQQCTQAMDCAGGSCADGFCCDADCAATCMACNGTGKVGTCWPIPKLKPDNNATTTCAGNRVCDGAGTCISKNGQPCGAAAQCLSSLCVDGRCCATSCTGTCRSCAVAGKAGSCSNIPRWGKDSYAAVVCIGNQACDGAGNCKLKNGQVCATGGQCTSGRCVDGHCCDTPCTGRCMTCSRIKGTCSKTQYNAEDLGPGKPCVSPGVCDGQGNCRTALGKACFTHGECSSNLCVDGNCCDSTCTGTCRACNLSGSQGKCAFMPTGQTDPGGTPACTGTSACDGKGACKKALGQTCAAAGDCASGVCSDGVCCDKACDATCMACNLLGTKGTCTAVAAGKPDPAAKPPCAGTSACDGKGSCTKGKGQSCTSGAGCVSGHCVDGVCCDSACSATCNACNVAKKEGTCSAVTKGQPDPLAITPCSGDKVCDGVGQCLIKQGKACSSATDCMAGFCKDGVCCDKACDLTCESCKLTESVGTCSFIPSNTNPDKECQGKDQKCGGLCDGKGQCDYPKVGVLCGTCKACDGTGQCSAAPPDDPSCGVIDCDKLDTSCRDYVDLTSNRCDSLGQCKPANTPTTCTKSTDLPCDGGVRDAKVAQDRGAAADTLAIGDRGQAPDARVAADLRNKPGGTQEGGCSCQASGAPWPSGASLILMLACVIGLASIRRRG